jgi:hypothetical protein
MTQARRTPRRGVMVAAGVALTTVFVVLGATVLNGPGDGDRAPSRSPVAPGFEKLDAASHALAMELEPNEIATVSLYTGTDERAIGLARRVREAGFEPGAIGGERPHLSVVGPHEPLIALAASALVTRATVAEESSALRPVSALLGPDRALPSPGLAYAGTGFPDDLATRAVPANLRVQLLAALAQTVTTIDGDPYRDLVFEASCSGEPEPVDCAIAVSGAIAQGVEQRDRWLLHAGAETGWLPAFDPANAPILQAIPRWLGREAERIARSDPAALTVIRGFDRIDGFSWDPAAASVIDVRYSRSCAGLERDLASIVGGPLASDGCIEFLRVRVDVGAGLILGLGQG